MWGFERNIVVEFAIYQLPSNRIQTMYAEYNYSREGITDIVSSEPLTFI